MKVSNISSPLGQTLLLGSLLLLVSLATMVVVVVTAGV